MGEDQTFIPEPPVQPTSDLVFLTVRGKTTADSVDSARIIHNEPAASPDGIAAARSLGDLSHKVYVPVTGAQSSAQTGELLFHDNWESIDGIMKFFSNPEVQSKGARLFSTRDATAWMPARGALAFDLPAPA